MLWALVVGAIFLAFCSSNGDSECSPHPGNDGRDDSGIRTFEGGAWDVENVFGVREKTDGTFSYRDYWDREITSDGRVIDNFGGIYDKNTGERLGTRWTDCFGIIHDEID